MVRPRALRNNRGQSMIESLAVAGALMTAVTLGLALLYFGFVHVSANYLLHEFLVCSATRGEHGCESRMRGALGSIVFMGRVSRFSSSSGVEDRRRAELVLAMPLGRSMTLRKELRL